jgi:hypothetical protein
MGDKTILKALHEREQDNVGKDLDRRQEAAESRGWTLSIFPDGSDATVPHSYSAGLGVVVAVHGTDRRDLLGQIEAWEVGQSRLRPEFRSKHIPDSHPLSPANVAKPKPAAVSSDADVVPA